MAPDRRVLSPLVAGLAVETHRLNEYLALEVAKRPTKAELVYRRALSVALILVMMWLGLQARDVAAQGCGPGYRADKVLNAFDHPIDHINLKTLRSIGIAPVSPWCDVWFPAVSHDPGASWPSSYDEFGFGLYFLAGGLGVIYLMRLSRIAVNDRLASILDLQQRLSDLEAFKEKTEREAKSHERPDDSTTGGTGDPSVHHDQLPEVPEK